MTPQEEKELAELDELDALDAEEAEPTWLRISKAKQDLARMQQARKDVEETTLGERVAAGVLGAANTMGMGFADEVRGLATAIPRLMPGGESPIDAYVRGRDVQRGEAKAAESRNLRSTLGGEVLGNAPTVLGGFAAKVPQSIATAAKQGVGALAKQGAKIGAAGGAVGGFGTGEGLMGSLEQALKGGTIGALFGGAGGGLGGLASAEARAASRTPKPAPEPAAPSAGPGMVRRGAASVVNMAAKAAEKGPMAAGAAIGGAAGGPAGAAVGGALGSEFGAGAGKAAGGYLAQLAQRLRGDVPDAPPSIPGLPEWQPAVGSSTATAKPAGTPLPPTVEAPPPIPQATPAGGASITAEELRGMGGANLMGELNKRLEAAGVTPPRVEPTPIPVLSKTTPARGRPVESVPAETSPGMPVDESDIIAAIPEQAWDKGMGAVERLKKVQESRDLLAIIAERLNEEEPARAAFFKKEIQSGAADPARVAAKTEELLAAGKNPQQINQALAVQRTKETGDIARIAKHEGGEDYVDNLVAMMIAKGAKTKGEIQDMTGLGIRDIDKALARHQAELDRGAVRQPKKKGALPEEEGGAAGPENTLWEPVYEEIMGKPWSAVDPRLTGKAKPEIKLPQSHTDLVSNMILRMREPNEVGIRATPVQIAKAISGLTKVEYTPDMIRAVIKSRETAP